MTPIEWADIVEWMDERFPKSWKKEQEEAYYLDVFGMDASDVWSAIFNIYESGMTFAPNGSQIVAKVIALRRDRAEQARYQTPSLPSPKTEEMPVGGWLGKWYPDEDVSWEEHIRRVHQKGRPCKSSLCDIHSQTKETA